MDPDAENNLESPAGGQPQHRALPPLPTEDAEQFIALISAILQEHDRMEAAQAGSSPAPLRLIDKLRALMSEVRSQPEKVTEKLGLAPGQDSSTPETGLHFVTCIREYLQLICFYNEATLRNFGFPTAETAGPQSPHF